MNNYNSAPGQNSTIEYIPLPKATRLPEGLGTDASPWLDEYNAFSRKWSPRSHDGYHEAIGLWELSTIAARRVTFHLGKCRFTNLMIALIGRTSITVKTSAAEIGKEVLNVIGLGGLLLPDTTTPQKMINQMSLQVPENYTELTLEQKEQARLGLAFAGQRGMYYDEFGTLISGMMRSDGIMADFRGHLRRFDDTPDHFENATIARGLEVIDRPYLALLASMTPADLSPYARSGSALWGDGFLARFAIVAPNRDFMKQGKFPREQRVLPASIIAPLRKWHEDLGIPKVEIVGSNAVVTPAPPHVIELSDEVYDAFYAYDEALREIVAATNNSDLDGNYSRLSEKGLRIAALFASLSYSQKIEMNHWARAQGITERWRMSLHNLYHQLNDQGSFKRPTNDEKVFRAIVIKGCPNSREIQQFTGLDKVAVQNSLDSLLEIRKIIQIKDGEFVRYMRSDLETSPTDGQDLPSF